MKMIDVILIQQFMNDNAVEVGKPLSAIVKDMIIDRIQPSLTDEIAKTLTLGSESHTVDISKAHADAFDEWADKEIESIEVNYGHELDKASIVLGRAIHDYMQAAANCGHSRVVARDNCSWLCTENRKAALREESGIQWYEDSDKNEI